MVAAPQIEQEDTGRDLASWLQEAGRRKGASRAGEEQSPPPAPDQPPRRFTLHVSHGTLRRAFILCALCIAYLQYYSMGVMLEISSLRSIVVFIGGATLP